MSKKGRIVVLDGDEIAFNCSAVGEQRSILATHVPSNRTKEFKNRTEFRSFIGDKWDEAEFLVKDVQKPAEYNTVKHITEKHTRSILSLYSADKSEIYISGDVNFRLSLPLRKPYKGERIFSIKPVHLQPIKNYLIRNGAVVVRDREADDMLAQRMFDGFTNNTDIVSVTVDKDARMTPGKLINPDTFKKEGIIEIPNALGSLEKVKLPSGVWKVAGCGRLWFYFQLIAGDKTDCYDPRDWLDKRPRHGDMKAYNQLVDCKDDAEALSVVAAQYREWYPSPFSFKDQRDIIHNDFTWVDCLQAIADCAYMRRAADDRWDARRVLSAVGVSYE